MRQQPRQRERRVIGKRVFGPALQQPPVAPFCGLDVVAILRKARQLVGELGGQEDGLGGAVALGVAGGDRLEALG